MMDLKEAKVIAAKAGIQVYFDNNLKMIALVLDDTVDYITKEAFESFDDKLFTAALAARILKYATTEIKPRKIRLH